MNKKFIAILVSVFAVCGMMAITGTAEANGNPQTINVGSLNSGSITATSSIMTIGDNDTGSSTINITFPATVTGINNGNYTLSVATTTSTVNGTSTGDVQSFSGALTINGNMVTLNGILTPGYGIDLDTYQGIHNVIAMAIDFESGDIVYVDKLVTESGTAYNIYELTAESITIDPNITTGSIISGILVYGDNATGSSTMNVTIPATVEGISDGTYALGAENVTSMTGSYTTPEEDFIGTLTISNSGKAATINGVMTPGFDTGSPDPYMGIHIIVSLGALFTNGTGSVTGYTDLLPTTTSIPYEITPVSYAFGGGVIKTNSIQSAVDAASSGDTINVAAGTYDENIVVNKSLTLRGANDGIPGSGIRGTESIINVADSTKYVVEITADNVTLDGFTITGLANNSENMAAVILKGKDHCTITNNILTNNYKDAINLFSIGSNYSDYNTVSNNVINGPAGVETFGIKIKGSYNTISDNEIYNTDSPIHIWSWDATETASPDYNIISGNTIGPGTGDAPHKYGIEIKTGQHNEVTGNTITGAQWAAIHLYTSHVMAPENNFDPRPANNTISNNTIIGGEVGIALLEGAKNNTVSNNNISSTTVAGILGSLSRWPTDWPSGLSSGLIGTPEQYLQIVDNIIENNILDNCGHGIAMQYGDDNSLTGNTIENNTSTININYHNISFAADFAGVYFDLNSEGNVAHFNNITGNTGGLKNANASTILDATNNWWGDATGPYHATLNPEGTGDAVSDNVDFDPWTGAETTEVITDTGSGVSVGTTHADVAITGGTATTMITLAEYTDNPQEGFAGEIGKYIDVYVPDATGVTELEIRLDYTDAEISGKDESSLKLLWWNGTRWVPCSDSGVNTASNYIWAKIRGDTAPTLDDLSGTPFAGTGNAAPSYSSSMSGQFSPSASYQNKPEEPEITPEITIEELEARVAELRAMISELQLRLRSQQALAYQGIPVNFTFKNDLKYGMTSDEVKHLQIILKTEIGSPTYPEDVPATGWFGPITKAAVIKFQEKYKSEILTPWNLAAGTGLVGSTTRAKLNSLLK